MPSVISRDVCINFSRSEALCCISRHQMQQPIAGGSHDPSIHDDSPNSHHLLRSFLSLAFVIRCQVLFCNRTAFCLINGTPEQHFASSPAHQQVLLHRLILSPSNSARPRMTFIPPSCARVLQSHFHFTADAHWSQEPGPIRFCPHSNFKFCF